ncbi:MAG: T9SS type A sorting domain-containing protein [Candidatus Coatesbacteria bacterium]|nr:MAG: T9SS type A sorting domain-containing protein [Candidatus Coatesbacteria bacterium]
MLILCATAVFAVESDGGWSRVGASSGNGYRYCGWGDSNYGGYRTYYYDPRGGNFRVWYVLEGPHALVDQRDRNKNGYPDVVETIATDFEWVLAKTRTDQWYYHPDPEEARYLPIRDYYQELGWPAAGEDYGGSNRWDVYCGAFESGFMGIAFAYGPFPGSARSCYSAYFSVDHEYDPDHSAELAADLWGAAITYMFDAAETSETPQQRWLVQPTAVWIRERTYPPAAPGKSYVDQVLRNPLQPITENGGAFLYFLEDWSGSYWKPPTWQPLDDKPLLKHYWRATSKGDAWYTADPALDRSTEEALSYLIEHHAAKNAYVEGSAFREAFELFTTWNWFTGARDDGRHYRYGSQYVEIFPQNTWTTYPVLNYEPLPGARMNYLGAGYYRFDSPPSWKGAVFEFAAAPGIREASRVWGGHLLASRNGTTWTDLAGQEGSASAMFTPGDRGVLRIDDPAQYQSLVAIIDCAAYEGTGLGFKYSFYETDDDRPPGVAAGVARPQANPLAMEILLGGDEELFGAEADVMYIPTGESTGPRREVELTEGKAGYSFMGTYSFDDPRTGGGVITWRAADVAGNVVFGQKVFLAGIITAGGGTVGNDAAAVKLPPGALRGPTAVTMVPGPSDAPGGRAALASSAPAEAKAVSETVGPTYDVGPNWARLARPAEIVLSYEGLPVEREDYLSVFRWNGAAWEDLGGTVDRRGRRVVATTSAFGTFSLGYGAWKGGGPPSGIPAAFALYQNFPNPVRGETTIKYALPAAADIELALYDLSGRRLLLLLCGRRPAGVHEVRFAAATERGQPLPAGVYLYRLTAGTEAATRKLIVGR